MRIKNIINYGMLFGYHTKFSGLANKEMFSHQFGELAFRYWFCKSPQVRTSPLGDTLAKVSTWSDDEPLSFLGPKLTVSSPANPTSTLSHGIFAILSKIPYQTKTVAASCYSSSAMFLFRATKGAQGNLGRLARSQCLSGFWAYPRDVVKF